MSSISKDQISDALLIFTTILAAVGATLIIFHISEKTGVYILMSGAVPGVIGGLMKRGTLDSWFTRSE